MLTVEQQAIRELARDFADREIVPHAAAWDRAGAFDRDVLSRLGELGFLGMLVPERYGGLGSRCAHLPGRAGGAGTGRRGAGPDGGDPERTRSRHPSRPRERSAEGPLAPSASHRETKIAGFALSEAHAGSDPSAMTTIATEGAGGWTVSGSKRWITNGASADLMLVFARTCEGERGKPATGAFVVDTASPGYRAGRREKTMGLRASETVSVDLDGGASGRRPADRRPAATACAMPSKRSIWGAWGSGHRRSGSPGRRWSTPSATPTIDGSSGVPSPRSAECGASSRRWPPASLRPGRW